MSWSPLADLCIFFHFIVLKQLVGELSALHSFVYGGEYPSPYHGNDHLEAINDVATLGAILQRSTEKRGYIVVDIPERDPDFHIIDGKKKRYPIGTYTSSANENFLTLCFVPNHKVNRCIHRYQTKCSN